MRLRTLVDRATALAPDLGWEMRSVADEDPNVHGLRLDSRLVVEGDLFFCVPGERSDGHDHAAQAVERGAGSVLVDRWLDVAAAQVRVPAVRPAMAWTSVAFHDDPSRQLRVVGITGTNGKTTTAHLVKAVFDHGGHASGLVGTLTGTRTTPEAPHLQASLRAMVDDGLDAVAMEVSSHALVQDRVTGTHFDVGVFTNLSPDHLDYHGSMEAYFQAKATFFRGGRVDAAVVNADDEYGRRLIDELHDTDMAVTAYRRSDATDVEMRLDGSAFTWRGQRVELSLPGHFNLENAIAAAEAVRYTGMSDAAIAAGLSAAGQVGGRFEVVATAHDGKPTVIVDYSHTPAGIEQVLRSVRAIDADAAVCIVFGAGGDRDREKRPLMAAAAEANADTVVITSDNPRSEDPDAIIADVLAGLATPEAVLVEPDRRAAIAKALAAAGEQAVVVIAGKGHETTQTIGDVAHEFDDRAVARELLARGPA